MQIARLPGRDILHAGACCHEKITVKARVMKGNGADPRVIATSPSTMAVAEGICRRAGKQWPEMDITAIITAMTRTPYSEPADTPLHQNHEALTDRLYASPGMLPSRYVYVLTNRCNLSCPFCFQYRHRTADPMTKTDWLDLTAQLPDYARVTLTGGEPLVFKGFLEILRTITDRHDCNIISNGVLLDDAWIDVLLSFPRLRVLSISIDDIGNRSRQLKPQLWRHLTSMMRLFINRRNASGSETLLDIKTVVLDDNADDLFEIYKFCVDDLACDTHAFQFLKGSPLQHADTMHDFDEIFEAPVPPVYQKLDIIREQLERVREHASHNHHRSFLHPPVGDLQCDSELPDLDYLNDVTFRAGNFSACKFPWSSVHINADGNLFPCMAVSMGNVKETPLQQIVAGAEFQRFRDVLRERGTVPGCHRCGWLRPRPQMLRRRTPDPASA